MTVYLSDREFPSIQDLIATATPELDGGLTTDAMQTYWWYGDRVRFETNTSAGMVEVEGQSVTVGYPSQYNTYRFEDGESALYWAWRKHQEWLSFISTHGKEDWRSFVNLNHDTSSAIHIRAQQLNPANRTPFLIDSRRAIAELLNWNPEGQQVANLWHLLAQKKGVYTPNRLPIPTDDESVLYYSFFPCKLGWDLSLTPPVFDIVDLKNLYG